MQVRPRAAAPDAQCRGHPGSGTRTLGAGPQQNRDCGLVRSARIEALRGRPDQYRWAPLSIRCRQLVLCPPGTNAQGHGRDLGSQASSAPLAPTTAASALSRRRRTARVGGPEGNQPMSRGLWFSMNARTRRSLTLLWTALFLFSLALQSVSWPRRRRLGHADRWGLPARRQRDRRRRRRGLGQHLRGNNNAQATTGILGDRCRPAVHPGVQGHPCHGARTHGTSRTFRTRTTSSTRTPAFYAGGRRSDHHLRTWTATRTTATPTFGFWFFQSTDRPQQPTARSAAPRTVGDLFVVSEFQAAAATCPRSSSTRGPAVA